MIGLAIHSSLARKLLAAAAILVAAAFVLRAWFATREDRMRLAATIDTQKQIIEAADRREREHADQLRGQLEAIDALKHRIATPQQIVRALPRYLRLPQPIQLTPQPTTQQGSPLPEKPGPRPAKPARPAGGPVAQLPVEDLKPLFDFVQDCRACQSELAEAKQQAADDRVKIDALTHERDAALRAVRGGSFWARARRAAKWFIVGVGVGAAITASARH